MPLKTVPSPKTDLEWRDLASITLSAFEEQERTNGSSSYDAPSPGSSDFAKTVDHTVLKIAATEDDVHQCCREAKQYGFKVSDSLQ